MQRRGAGQALVDFVRVRVVGTDKRALLDAAARQGVSLSEFTRQAMTEAVQRLAA